MFSDDAFFELASRSNPEYAAVMMSLSCGNDPASNIWDIPSFNPENKSHIKSEALLLGRCIVDHLKRSEQEDAESKAAREVRMARNMHVPLTLSNVVTVADQEDEEL